MFNMDRLKPDRSLVFGDSTSSALKNARNTMQKIRLSLFQRLQCKYFPDYICRMSKENIQIHLDFYSFPLPQRKNSILSNIDHLNIVAFVFTNNIKEISTVWQNIFR